MSAKVTSLGKLFCKITEIELAGFGSEKVEHGLPAAPVLVAPYNIGDVGTGIQQGPIGIADITAKHIVFINLGDNPATGECTAGCLHSMIA